MSDENRLLAAGDHETTNSEALDDLVVSLQQAEATLSAIVDQACLNGPDVVKPAALITAHNLTHDACGYLDQLLAGDKPKPTAVDSTPPPAETGSILDFEGPLIMARGEAAALHAGLCGLDDPLVGAAWALERRLDDLYSQWDEMVEARRQAKERAA